MVMDKDKGSVYFMLQQVRDAIVSDCVPDDLLRGVFELFSWFKLYSAHVGLISCQQFLNLSEPFDVKILTKILKGGVGNEI